MQIPFSTTDPIIEVIINLKKWKQVPRKGILISCLWNLLEGDKEWKWPIDNKGI